MNEDSEKVVPPKIFEVGDKSSRFGMTAEVGDNHEIKFNDEVAEERLETLVKMGKPVEPNKNPLADLVYKKIEEKMTPEQKEQYRINSEKNLEDSRDIR